MFTELGAVTCSCCCLYQEKIPENIT
ncbi:MAG: hypothetical protein C4323_01745 [Mastigocladus sp. ERB_26_2]